MHVAPVVKLSLQRFLELDAKFLDDWGQLSVSSMAVVPQPNAVPHLP